MTRYEYKVVPAPTKAGKAKGIKSAEGRFARTIEDVLNEMGAEGWEFQRAELLPSEERHGITRSATTNWRNVLVFRRAVGESALKSEPMVTAAPVPPLASPVAPAAAAAAVASTPDPAPVEIPDPLPEPEPVPEPAPEPDPIPDPLPEPDPIPDPLPEPEQIPDEPDPIPDPLPDPFVTAPPQPEPARMPDPFATLPPEDQMAQVTGSDIDWDAAALEAAIGNQNAEKTIIQPAIPVPPHASRPDPASSLSASLSARAAAIKSRKTDD